MGSKTGNISRDMYSEQKEYHLPEFQQGPNKPPVDADFNDAFMALYTVLRRFTKMFGDGSPNNGFLIAVSGSPNNNFTVKGGTGTLDGAGRILVEGFQGLLVNDLEWTDNTVNADRIHDRSTALTATKLTCTAKQYAVNELAGRTLVPNVIAGTGFTIVSNTVNEIVITGGDMTTVAVAGDIFRVEMSTPVGVRTDIVYADFYLDEVDDTEDINLKHPLSGGFSFASAFRFRLKHTLEVRENSTTVPTGAFTDPDGNIHYYVKLATLSRTAVPAISTITDNVSRDLFNIASIRTEIIAARGTEATLNDRLSESLANDGTLNANVVGNLQVKSTADIDQEKIANSDTYDDTYTGVPTDLEDDLNRLRNEVKEIKGTAAWETAPTRSLNAVEAEVTTARGSKASVDARLDISLNEDGTIKSNAIGAVLPRLAGEQSLLLYPLDGAITWKTTYQLHQFRGFLAHATSGNPIYAEYSLDHVAYPLQVVMGATQGPGGADNNALTQSVGLYWYYIYLIAKDDGTLALIYSTSALSPWTNGPDLAYGAPPDYDFAGNGWKYWKFIAAVRNGQAGSWEIVPMRKIGNHVEYEQAQYQFNGSGGSAPTTQFSLSNRVPETSMRANILMSLAGENDGSCVMYVRPASVISVSERMMLQDTVPLSPLSTLGPGWKLMANTAYANATNGNSAQCTGWVDTDDWQRIDYLTSTGGAGVRTWVLYVLGYIEFTEFASGEVAVNW